MKKQFHLIFLLCSALFAKTQNPLVIPPALTGTTFNLNVQNGVVQFFDGINTPTFGINGDILGPTIIVNKWDWVTINVTNSLTGTAIQLRCIGMVCMCRLWPMEAHIRL